MTEQQCEEVPRFDGLPPVEAAVRTTLWLVAYLDGHPNADELLSDYGMLVAAGSRTHAAAYAVIGRRRSEPVRCRRPA